MFPPVSIQRRRRGFVRSLAASALAAVVVLQAPVAQAADWPSKPVRIVVAYPAGGGVDSVARALAERLGKELGQQVIVENRPGASGALGAGLVARAEPDGYTLLLSSPAEVVVGPLAGQKVPYDPAKDFAPIGLVGETPLGIAAHPSAGVNDLAALLAAGRRGDKLSYGTPGSGSSMHFAGVALNALANGSMLHVPYKGAAPATNDLLGGQIPIAIVGLPPLLAHAKAGRIRILATTTLKRSSALPDVPAVAEFPGFQSFQFSNWMGLFAPAGTSGATVQRLSSAMTRITSDPAMRTALIAAGVEPRGLSTAEFVDFLRSERERYSAIASKHSIRFGE